jgi:hypothetical protein
MDGILELQEKMQEKMLGLQEKTLTILDERSPKNQKM